MGGLLETLWTEKGAKSREFYGLEALGGPVQMELGSVTRLVRFTYFHVRRVQPEFSSTRKLRYEAEITKTSRGRDEPAANVGGESAGKPAASGEALDRYVFA